MRMKPRKNPAMGDVNIGTITFQRRPLPSHQCSLLGTDQMSDSQLLPEAASAEPHRPPIRAWLELEGSPNHQVMRFHTIAPMSAQMMTSDVIATILVSTRPDEIVLATAVPHMAPTRLVNAAMITAWRGVRTFVETMVAME